MKKQTIKINESQLRQIVKESICHILNETDRHRPGYWKERWAKQKAMKQQQQPETKNSPTKKSKPQKDRHRKGYYKEYNKKHPERLNRGFTKGYYNGNVDDGVINGRDNRIWLDPDTYIVGYDEIGRPITNHPLSDLLRNKEMEWHDDDWTESQWGTE